MCTVPNSNRFTRYMGKEDDNFVGNVLGIFLQARRIPAPRPFPTPFSFSRNRARSASRLPSFPRYHSSALKGRRSIRFTRNTGKFVHRVRQPNSHFFVRFRSAANGEPGPAPKRQIDRCDNRKKSALSKSPPPPFSGNLALGKKALFPPEKAKESIKF